MRCTQSHMASCHQCGLTRKLGFQSRYFHPEFALYAALERVGIDPNRDRDWIEQKPLNVFEPTTNHGLKVIVRRLEEIGSKLAEVTSIVNEPSRNMEFFGITEVKISNSNGTLASSLEPPAYREFKIATMQDYHAERIRLLDHTTAWYKERGQEHTHTRLPQVYERYTEGKGKGKASKGSRNHRPADGKDNKRREQHQEEQTSSGWGSYYTARRSPRPTSSGNGK